MTTNPFQISDPVPQLIVYSFNQYCFGQSIDMSPDKVHHGRMLHGIHSSSPRPYREAFFDSMLVAADSMVQQNWNSRLAFPAEIYRLRVRETEAPFGVVVACDRADPEDLRLECLSNIFEYASFLVDVLNATSPNFHPLDSIAANVRILIEEEDKEARQRMAQELEQEMQPFYSSVYYNMCEANAIMAFQSILIPNPLVGWAQWVNRSDFKATMVRGADGQLKPRLAADARLDLSRKLESSLLWWPCE